MTIRFETRASGPGIARTVRADLAEISRGNPIDSLDWRDYLDVLYQSTE